MEDRLHRASSASATTVCATLSRHGRHAEHA
jgi:hypothetical protein